MSASDAPTEPRWGAELARRVEGWAREQGPGLVVGVSAPQGSGKSTACAETARTLEARGLRTAVVALDDLYLPRSERERLARDVHPLLRTRGPPGTHDARLGARLLDSLRRSGTTRLPRFSKARDDREAGSTTFDGPADVVLLEGWCVGVPADAAAAASPPINALEREEDTDGRWRAGVEAQLAGPYRELWARLDRLVVLVAPGWETVCAWRAGAEAELRLRDGGGMGEAELARFMMIYERLTRRAAEALPAKADVVLHLDRGRRLQAAAPAGFRPSA